MRFLSAWMPGHMARSPPLVSPLPRPGELQMRTMWRRRITADGPGWPCEFPGRAGGLRQGCVADGIAEVFRPWQTVLFLRCGLDRSAWTAPVRDRPVAESEGNVAEEEQGKKQLIDLLMEGLERDALLADGSVIKWDAWQQGLVDCAYLCFGLLLCEHKVFRKLSDHAQGWLRDGLLKTRQLQPFNNNWVLFSAMVECFLQDAWGIGDKQVVKQAINKVNSWYVGDGLYKDGDSFALITTTPTCFIPFWVNSSAYRDVRLDWRHPFRKNRDSPSATLCTNP